MNKVEFLNQIENNLKEFKEEETKEIINYYDEIIADKIEAGLSETEAVRSLGNVSDITNEIKVNIVMNRSDKKSTNALKNFLIILGIASTPILLPLGIVFAILFITLFIVLFALVFSFGASGIAVIIAIITQSVVTVITTGEIGAFFIQLGLGLAAGSILLLLTIELFKLTKFLLNKTNKLFSKVIKKRLRKEV